MGIFSFLPALNNRQAENYQPSEKEITLKKIISHYQTTDDNFSGAVAIPEPHEALALRLELARLAEHSIDVQYYIFYHDLAGSLLVQELIKAADRGVKVRFLIDDNETIRLDYLLREMNQHENISVRIFNPWYFRQRRLFGLVLDFFRLNRRMHNKSFTVDNLVTVVGGRNIGDEYFSARATGNYRDMDALLVGPFVDTVTHHFDKYWNSLSAYQADMIVCQKTQKPTKDDRNAREKNNNLRNKIDYTQLLSQATLPEALRGGNLPLVWAEATLVVDPPEKVLGRASRKKFVIASLWKSLGEPQKSLNLLAGYFVPTDQLISHLASMVQQGVKVSVYTNAFETSDVWIVMAGYGPTRKKLLQSGVRVFEMRASAPGKPERSLMGSKKTGHHYNNRPSTLHAKTISADGERLFIGSFNIDPRSVMLNTEMGVVLNSQKLTADFDHAFDKNLCATAYEVKLDDQGNLNWIYQEGGKTITLTTEPGTKWWQRMALGAISWLPIKWLL